MRTRCPACETVFRVTSEQLRAKAGKVRCGYCQAVFNAFDELIDETRQAAAMELPGEAQVRFDAATTEYAPDDQADAIETAVPDEAVLSPEPETGEESDEAETAVTPAAEPEPEIEKAGEAEPAQDEHPDAVPEQADSDTGEQGEVDSSGTSAAIEAESSSAEVVDEKPEEATQAAREAGLAAARELSETPAFDRWAAGALSGGNSGGFETDDGGRTNWVFVTAAVLLAAILTAQLAYHFRTELVRFIPSAAGVFDALEIQVPQSARSDLVSIEASDLQVDNARGLFVLNAVLHNRADHAQAMPALELTLIDAADKPVARRVMKPAEYLPPGSTLTSFPANAEIPVRMWIDARGLGASGYRLYIFYP